MRSVSAPIHPAGWPFIGLFAVITAGVALLWLPLGAIGLILTLWCIYFFRNPDRRIPDGDDLIIAPADGVVQQIETASPPPEIAADASPRQRISIFMNVFNVHVNRLPVTGRIAGLAYKPGRFFNASLDKASELNERQSIQVISQAGAEFIIVQIAGLIARRIRCDLRQDQPVEAGERFGLIRFGSRVDVYLPDGIETLVSIGQKTVAGETVLAKLEAQAPQTRTPGQERRGRCFGHNVNGSRANPSTG